MVSAHYDTTIHSTGAIDNASGVAVLMEIARQIANYSIQREVRFILFSGEENYLYGSRYYVSKLTDNERQHIIANLNLDCIGEEGTNEAILGTSNGRENEVSKLFANYDIEIQKGPMTDFFRLRK
ncbi:M28 family metallopeptidase [Desulfosporosinus nitroreducens]|uniref:M28 family metallopeptidase n=1 Tax=Desulfosporosinus nitroreducens TaxID=2018668 RepID=A0ABT8QUY6_9FIRM|nr:M20/M25/M40 family metallo-hydrolase [Desulfosporosinus nitroreducens]MDO0823878.1 M28 family metallopeptidase [Desulfosporosinus nitroreducens]